MTGRHHSDELLDSLIGLRFSLERKGFDPFGTYADPIDIDGPGQRFGLGARGRIS
ncbi:hypothetical protein [Nocardia otitidiscaviarum]|uniref:hypothetical protein n=1 Tax=Nocardia otitidiscaviarum TaxID=1823 RepID=UPI002457A514|nr:hypothetical protein [Nocardia otitidiscaviarum]